MPIRLTSVIDQHEDRDKIATQELAINPTREVEGRHSLFLGTLPLCLMGGVPVFFPPDVCDVPVIQHVYKFWYKKGLPSKIDNAIWQRWAWSGVEKRHATKCGHSKTICYSLGV